MTTNWEEEFINQFLHPAIQILGGTVPELQQPDNWHEYTLRCLREIIELLGGAGGGGGTIENNSVTTAKLADGAVTTEKVANSAITSAKIQDGSIVTADIADGAITSAKIADGTIQTADFLPGANSTVLQTSNVGAVQWAKVPTLAIAPGANETVLTTNNAGVVVWSASSAGAPADGSVTAQSLTLGATAWFAFANRLTGVYSDVRRSAMAELLDTLTTTGLLPTIVILNIAGQNETDTLLNWVKDRYNSTKQGTPSFVSDRGFTGAAGGNWLRTGFQPANANTVYQKDSATIGIYSRTDGVSSNTSACLSGGPGLDYSQLLTRDAGGQFSYKLNSTNGGGNSIGSSLGLFTATRIDDTTISAYHRGVLHSSDPEASTALTSGEMAWCGDGFANGWPGNQAAFVMASGWTAQNNLDFYNALQTYLTSFGAAV